MIADTRLRRDFDAVIFDMDGTIVDTERVALAAWQHAATEHGFDFREEIFYPMIGRRYVDNANYLRGIFGESFDVDKIRTRCLAVFESKMSDGEVKLKHGILPLIKFLRSLELPLAVATSTRRQKADRMLDRLGVLELFEKVVGGDEVQNGKPHPDIYLEAASRLRINPDRVLVLEDSGPGIQAALAAGMRVALVRDMAIVEEHLRCKCLRVCETALDVQKLFESSNQ